ncbi:DNA-directed RNA polymerase II subunit rpb1 [Chytriomyces hyalinus]|nr:DNA-directed RNA polymerase II subunit rpb1 [Chytriomyces hyalinus]
MPEPAILKPVPLWTGKHIVLLTIPEIELKVGTLTHAHCEDAFKQDTADLLELETRWAQAKFYNLMPHDTRVLILKCQLLTGYLSKKTVGTLSGGLVHVIYMDFGPEAARDF